MCTHNYLYLPVVSSRLLKISPFCLFCLKTLMLKRHSPSHINLQAVGSSLLLPCFPPWLYEQHSIPIKTRGQNPNPPFPSTTQTQKTRKRKKTKPSSWAVPSSHTSCSVRLQPRLPALGAPLCHAVPRHAGTAGIPSPPALPPGANCWERGEQVTSQLSSSLSAGWLVFKLSPPFLTCWPSPPRTPRGGIRWLQLPETRGEPFPQPGVGGTHTLHPPAASLCFSAHFSKIHAVYLPSSTQRAAKSREAVFT